MATMFMHPSPLSTVRTFQSARRTLCGRGACVAVLILVSGALADTKPALETCTAAAGFEERGRSRAARDIELASGRLITLAGLVVPPNVEKQAHHALSEILEAQPLRYIPTQDAPDRYNRRAAHVAYEDGTTPHWLQEIMLTRGLALVDVQSLPDACARVLLGFETLAQRSGAGLWSGPVPFILPADDLEALRAAAGSYRLVEGRVTSIAERSYAAFINFGTPARAFSIMIGKTDLASIKAAFDFSGLKGQRLRVRGVLESAYPRIRVRVPLALERLDTAPQ